MAAPSKKSLQLLVDEMAEDFADRLRRGEQPAIADYTKRYPDHAERIAAVLRPIAMLERLKPGGVDSVGGRKSRSPNSARLGQPKLETLGDYRIDQEIGRGGMGIVYSATHESLGRRVAIKVLPAGVVYDDRQLQRFRMEARAAARLHHPNIVPVFGAGESNGHFYYVMELIEGRTIDQLRGDATSHAVHTQEFSAQAMNANPLSSLAARTSGVDADSESKGESDRRATDTQILNRNQSLLKTNWHRIADFGRQVADALAYAHEQGIVHRDIKPANLLLDHHENVWITDFGLARRMNDARMTGTGDLLGTPQYMPPENIQGHSDERGDIYSLGVTLYELLTGQPAFQANSVPQMLHLIANETPTPPRRVVPNIPRDLDTIVMKAIARDPSTRYQSAADLHSDLNRFLHDRPIRARRVTFVEHAWRWSRRNPAIAALSLLAVVLMIGVVASVLIGNQRYRSEFARAESSLTAQTTALAQLQTQHDRAERNHKLAMEAFTQIMDRIATRGLSQSTQIGAAMSASGTLTQQDIEILQTLLEYFEVFARENSANADAQLARARMQIADIHLQLGEFSEAENVYKSALQVFQSVKGATPRDQLHELQILNALASLACRRSDRDEARKRYRETMEFLATIPAPSNDVRFESARANGVFASFESQVGIISLQDSITQAAKRLRGKRENRDPRFAPPEPPPPRPPGQFRNARPFHNTRRHDESLRAITDAISVFEELTEKFPTEPRYRAALGRSLCVLADLQSVADLRQADATVAKAMTIFAQLKQEFPDSPAWIYEHARAAIAFDPFDGADAYQRLEAALADANQLLRTHADQPEYGVLRADALRRLATVQRHRRRPDAAGDSLERAITQIEPLTKRFPDQPLYQMKLTLLSIDLARNLAPRDRKGASDLLDSAIAGLESFIRNNADAHFLKSLLRTIRNRRDDLTGGF